jgi:hypothetical protein
VFASADALLVCCGSRRGLRRESAPDPSMPILCALAHSLFDAASTLAPSSPSQPPHLLQGWFGDRWMPLPGGEPIACRPSECARACSSACACAFVSTSGAAHLCDRAEARAMLCGDIDNLCRRWRKVCPHSSSIGLSSITCSVWGHGSLSGDIHKSSSITAMAIAISKVKQGV